MLSLRSIGKTAPPLTSHLRLVVKIANGHRGYGLPISDVTSEGNVGLMQALERFEPEKGLRLATYDAWWIRAAIQEYILRSWSLVKIGTASNQRKLFFNLRKAKCRIYVLDEGDMRPDQVKLLAKRLGVTEHNVIDMNRRLGGDASLNAPIREDGHAGERQDWLVDESPSQERILIKNEELEGARRWSTPCRNSALASAGSSKRGAWPKTRSRLECSLMKSASRASGCGRSRYLPLRKCERRSNIELPPWSGLNAGITDLKQFHMGFAPRDQTRRIDRE
jgi:RNA polymerase sigma-32 factor